MACKLLLKPTWILGWLRGCTGLLFVILAILLSLAALDFYSYKQLDKTESIANVNFIKIAPQQYRASLVTNDGEELTYELNGDLWQLDARIFKWSPALAKMGLLPGYRLDRLSGRYVSLEEEKTLPRSVYALYNSDTAIDVWNILQDYKGSFSLVQAQYGSATYMPMTDGALFTVRLTANGLSAIPLNERAQSAVSEWE